MGVLVGGGRHALASKQGDVRMAVATPRGSPEATADDTWLCAFVAAWHEVGLRWRWDRDTYRERSHRANERECIRMYLESEEPGLLAAFDADFLIDTLHAAVARCHDALIAGGGAVVARGSTAKAQQWPETRRVEAGA